jgi:16S rRNA processing protein RimM
MTLPANLIDMGYIATAFGIQGWVKIKVATEYADSLNDYSQIFLRLVDGNIVQQKIEDGFAREGVFHAKFAGITNRDQAFALKGATVLVDRQEFPSLDANEYYWVDLIGLAVVNQQGHSLGTVKNLMETGANDVLVVIDGTTQRLIPFVAQYVVNVDMANKQISVDWGLDY